MPGSVGMFWCVGRIVPRIPGSLYIFKNGLILYQMFVLVGDGAAAGSLSACVLVLKVFIGAIYLLNCNFSRTSSKLA